VYKSRTQPARFDSFAGPGRYTSAESVTYLSLSIHSRKCFQRDKRLLAGRIVFHVCARGAQDISAPHTSNIAVATGDGGKSIGMAAENDLTRPISLSPLGPVEQKQEL
jgi:hypothetical protein